MAGLPRELDGFTILHLSDLHAGTPSLNMRAFRKGVDFGVECGADLVALTGDIVSHPRASRRVVEELERLRPPFGIVAVLGNHDVGASNDPFSRGVDHRRLGRRAGDAAERPGPHDRGVGRAHRGGRPRRGGVARRPCDRRPESSSRARRDLRLLLAHFPEAAEELAPGTADLVLCGHLHGGQICLPTPWGKLRLAHGVHRFREGIYRDGETTVVVTRGLGTTLVPFRVAARPEVSLLRLRPA